MKFLVTDECVRLARWLRLCGYDSTVASVRELSSLYRQAYNEGRVIVTRNHKVKGGSLFSVITLSSQRLEEQLRQLANAGVLTIDDASTFTRCDICNIALEPIEKSQVKGLVAPYVFKTQEKFHTCQSCKRIYWAATHRQRISKLLNEVHC